MLENSRFNFFLSAVSMVEKPEWITEYNIKIPQLHNTNVLKTLSRSFAFDPFI